MYKNKLAAAYLFSCIAVISFSACEKEIISKQEIIQSKTIEQNEEIDDYSDGPGEDRVPYPTILKETFIPSNPQFAVKKCHTWKITWPAYPAGMDPEKIPTVFKTSTGALNSVYYLNNTHPQNTLTADFSLYQNTTLEAAVEMWEELDYREPTMEPVYFYKTTYSAKTIEGWVKERPELFKINWQTSHVMETGYQAGDIFLFKLANKDLYGGIRIVSMNPRVIEVYLAVPNI